MINTEQEKGDRRKRTSDRARTGGPTLFRWVSATRAISPSSPSPSNSPEHAWAERDSLTPSTTGSRVHATRCCPLSPLPSHTVPGLRRRSSSGRCIAAHLRPAQKAMGDEGFATGTDSSCGWSSAKECGSRVRARSLVLFLLSSDCRDYYNIKTAKLFLQQQFLHA